LKLKRIMWRTRAIINEYPRPFWTLVIATFIDRLGGSILFPFFTLYITRKFGVGMTTVGIIFGIFSITGIVGSTIGGALSDRFGRKWMLILGLVMSALSSIWLGLVNDIQMFVIGAVVVGLLSNIGGPAQQAMVADLLPEEQRSEGYGIIRVTFNLAVVIGPILGGFLATRSYLSLFIADAFASLVVATIVYLLLPETRVSLKEREKESIAVTFMGYGKVFRDRIFMVFWVASALMTAVYIQMNSTLAVYLRDSHGITVSQFGVILSMNALMVVLFQFPITRRITKYPALSIMAWGALLYTIGFAMYGVFADYGMFLFAMVVITIGEMFIAPVSQSLVANFSPEDMRGRYMAFFGFSWAIPFAIAPLLAGLLMDNGDARLVWLAAGIVGTIATTIFAGMHFRIERAEEPAQQPA
jgi:MFS family permease